MNIVGIQSAPLSYKLVFQLQSAMNKLLPKIRNYFNTLRLPFRLKIIIPFLLLGVGLILGGTLIATRIVFENASERFHNQLMEGGKLAAEWMVTEENNQLEALRLMAYTSGVPEALAGGDVDSLRNSCLPIAINQQVEAVEFLDAGGNLVFSMRHQPGNPVEEYQFSRDGDRLFHDYTFVQNVLQTRVDPRGDKYSGIVQQGDQVHFYVAGPVYGAQDQPAGAILVGITLKTLTTHLRDQTLARITLYDPAGTPLSSSFDLASIPALDDATLTPVKNLQNSSTRPLRILETDFVELISPWKARGQDLGMLGVTFAEPIFINPSIPTRVSTFLFILAGFALIILTGLLIANSITRPLVGLTDASKAISRGELEIQVPAPRMNDELTDLTHTFNQMVTDLNQANTEILETYDTTLLGWALALELREKETAHHDERVADMAVRLASEMGIQGEELVHLRRGALLHDIGKMGIPDAILNKPTELTEEEFIIMRRHPTYAHEILSRIDYLQPALDIPYSHHERWDGTGYPQGLRGETIPLAARIFAVCDVWDAITTDRVYRKAMPVEDALVVIQQGAGTHFDPNVVEVFLRIVADISPDLFPIPLSAGDGVDVHRTG